ncbi:MAG: helix-turn-helix domain-containing protein [Ruminococcus sp.]|nr:helix-turn-helix domain-containing protein [Ruminococcus sp.]
MKSMSEILRELRTSKSMTQSDVAKILGLTTNAYQSYERGTSEPGCKALNKLADFYGVTTDYLLGREPLPNPFAELNLSNDDEAAVMQKFMSLPESFRACALELLRELGGAVKGTESVQPTSQSEPEQIQRSDTYTCGELEEIQKESDYNQDAG